MGQVKRFTQIFLTLTGGYLLVQAMVEFYGSAPGVGDWFGRFTPVWAGIFLGFGAFCLLAFAGLAAALWYPAARPLERGRGAIAWVTGWPRWLRWGLALLLVLLPTAFLLYTSWGAVFSGPYLRLLLLLFCAAGATLLVGGEFSPGKGVERAGIKRAGIKPAPPTEVFVFMLLLSASLFAIGERLMYVTGYPFSLTWSEGNRLYDYSVFIDPGRYLTAEPLKIPSGAIGRGILWGMLFAIPNSPIWLHRLWDAILWTAPYLLLGWLLAGWRRTPRLERWSFALWVFLFLLQGPIYTPLVLSAVLVAGMVRPGKLGRSLLAAGLAGYYAALSRWTWLPAAAAWTVLVWIEELEITPREKPGAQGPAPLRASIRHLIRRLFPIALVGIAGLAGGALANDKLFSPKALAGSRSFDQPLLWARLLPNATYEQGILWGLALACGPLVVLLVMLAFRGRTALRPGWQVNWLQGLVYAGGSLLFLAMGLVASVKIGGGSNLHNLDMFLVTLAFITGLARKRLIPGLFPSKEGGSSWPRWMQALVLLAVFFPAWNAVQSGVPLQLPKTALVDEALQTIQSKAAKALRRGEVLFIDQRQLLTFGSVQNVPLVEAYEKKYLMDQAMAGDADYFAAFYQELAAQRFALIITEPLYLNQQNPDYSFDEENNAWVTWVANPLLCYYAPVGTYSEVSVQLLVPRDEVQGCPKGSQ